ncbi:MAG: c-type cytochrome [Nitrospiraceae bacterium]
MGTFLRSRRRVVGGTLGLLLLLDLGRSIYARVGYSQPFENWQPDPSVHAELTWPPGADLSPDTPTGQRVFAQRCAVCHGPDGRGNGPAAPALTPRPRDFTRGQFKYKSTPPGQPPSDADLIRTVSTGLRASAMPFWQDILSAEEIREVVAHVKSLSNVFAGPAPTPLTIPPRVPPDAASIGRGRALFTAKTCIVCHGPEARGGVRLVDAKGQPVISRDLTAPWTFRGGSEPEQIWLRITTGLAPSPMPSFADMTTPDERWDLVNFVLSLSRIPPWEPGGQFGGPGRQADLVKRGDYLVHAQMCGLCHTQATRGGIYRDEFYLAGGQRVDVWPHGVLVSRNLTSDPDTGLGRWTPEQIIEAFRNGKTPERHLNVFDMPWHFLHALKDDDAQAIAGYLKTLTPVRNLIPPPLRYGIVETVVGKLTRPLPAALPETITFLDGNFGQSTAEPIRRHLPQEALIMAQWLVLGLGVVAFILAGPSERRWPRRPTGWVLLILGVAGIGILALLLRILYEMPATAFIPPEVIANPVLATVHEPDPATFRNQEHGAMVMRGKYLFTISSCAMCHQGNGEGDRKTSWAPAGTRWSRNISSHPTNGIGAWSDAALARAIRSGVSANGRALHWQGMIWDFASNWDEEDIRSLVAYIRTLPPVDRKVPDPQPPSAADCEKATVWVGENDLPGCL